MVNGMHIWPGQVQVGELTADIQRLAASTAPDLLLVAGAMSVARNGPTQRQAGVTDAERSAQDNEQMRSMA